MYIQEYFGNAVIVLLDRLNEATLDAAVTDFFETLLDSTDYRSFSYYYKKYGWSLMNFQGGDLVEKRKARIPSDGSFEGNLMRDTEASFRLIGIHALEGGYSYPHFLRSLSQTPYQNTEGHCWLISTDREEEWMVYLHRSFLPYLKFACTKRFPDRNASILEFEPPLDRFHVLEKNFQHRHQLTADEVAGKALNLYLYFKFKSILMSKSQPSHWTYQEKRDGGIRSTISSFLDFKDAQKNIRFPYDFKNIENFLDRMDMEIMGLKRATEFNAFLGQCGFTPEAWHSLNKNENLVYSLRGDPMGSEIPPIP